MVYIADRETEDGCNTHKLIILNIRLQKIVVVQNVNDLNVMHTYLQA